MFYFTHTLTIPVPVRARTVLGHQQEWRWVSRDFSMISGCFYNLKYIFANQTLLSKLTIENLRYITVLQQFTCYLFQHTEAETR